MEVPQPLSYLIQDTASRHGRLRISSSASFIQSDDESAISELLLEARTSALSLVRLAPTVLTSSASPRETARVLRELGLSPAVQDAEPAVVRLKRTTAVSGSGPAYVFLFIEALQQAAAELGFTPEQGRQLAIETVQGAAALAAQSSEPASTLRERVTSKGGTTEAALKVMAERGVKEGIVAGCKAAEARGQELGKILGAG